MLFSLHPSCSQFCLEVHYNSHLIRKTFFCLLIRFSLCFPAVWVWYALDCRFSSILLSICFLSFLIGGLMPVINFGNAYYSNISSASFVLLLVLQVHVYDTFLHYSTVLECSGFSLFFLHFSLGSFCWPLIKLTAFFLSSVQSIEVTIKGTLHLSGVLVLAFDFNYF